MLSNKTYKFWFCTGSQDLYGDECLRKVAEHSAKMVEALNASDKIEYEIVLKPTLISQASIRQTLNDATMIQSVLVLSHGVILSHRQRCGSLV